ncbi:MAG: class I SAM-dependent methyltransferase [Actinomycetota bacterium]
MNPGASGGPEAGSPDQYDRARGGAERGERFARMLDPLFAGRGPTLDVGAGTGMVACHLAALGRPVLGVDRTHDMLLVARRRMGDRVVLGDAERLPLRSGAVADAYSVWLLHLVDIPTVLREVARILRPGGRYLVTATSDGRPGDHPVRGITEEMSLRLRGGADRPDEPENVAALAEGPFRTVGIVEGDTQVFTTTPDEAATLLERRIWFMVRRVDEATWDEVVAPAIAALRALPDQHEVVRYEVRPRVLVLERRG